MEVEFWYEFASTYSFLAAERAQPMVEGAGHRLVLRPFLLGPIFAAQGWRDSPFNLYPAKGRYMWRDMERLCRDRRLEFRRPAVFPKNGLNAARIAFLGQDAPWGVPFTRLVYRANFQDDLDIADLDVLATLLEQMGVEPKEVIARSRQDDIKRGLRAQTERAIELGIFGAPTFVVGGELFWGDDRLQDALRWAVGLVKS
ncbi:MAG: 2-hydroxychromene-2-carboxylate isomerase [Myxococcales bacterium]|nr:2-hydroxychromene-2-carboxylate isomerase [Myxococcales bacterium]